MEHIYRGTPIQRCILIILLIFFLTICAGCLTSPMADLTVESKVDNSGNISNYEVTISMNQATYQEYLRYVESEGYTSVKDYIFREIDNPDQVFRFSDSPKDNTRIITFENLVPLTKENTFSTLQMNKSGAYWDYRDLTYMSNHIIKMKWINTLDYSLIIPEKTVVSNAHENHPFLFGIKGYMLNWYFDNHIDDDLIGQNSIIMSDVNAKFEAPQTPGFTAILGIISIFVVFCLRKKR